MNPSGRTRDQPSATQPAGLAQAATAPSHSLAAHQPSGEGCGEALGARHAIGAALRASGNRLITVNATGCLEALSTTSPETALQLPWLRSLSGNAAAVATGVAAAQRIKGRADVRVVAQGGDGGTADIGFGCLSGMFERNDDVLYICYDSEACLNSGARHSAAMPAAAPAAPPSARGGEPGNAFGIRKNLPLIAMAHRIPYVATASVADLPDLERKVTYAIRLRGARYIHIHAPCPPGWGSAPADTLRIARLAVASGLFPLFEAHDGRVTACTPLRYQVPVDEYLGLQTRFAHLFVDAASRERVAQIQEIADRNVAELGLLAKDAAPG